MSIIPPKRLFHIPSMSTVIYEDVFDDVKNKGYIAISHVWGEQKKYKPDDLEIVGGIDWKIPLSDIGKMSRVVNAINHFKKEYCWFDVLCMPQGEDRQWEVNLEIPFMGDYYSGADITLVLGTIEHNPSESFKKWYDIMEDALETQRELTREEDLWIITYKGSCLLDISKDLWFTRVWTWQEAVMSKKVIFLCNNGSHLDLSDIVKKVSYMHKMDTSHPIYLFEQSSQKLVILGNAIEVYEDGSADLTDILTTRSCFKIHDKFYGMLGILGYKDFTVDYDISIEELNKRIAQYAYSKGDISWISIGGNAGGGFIQPLYEELVYVGDYWEEDVPGICGIKFEDNFLCINAMSFATVVSRKSSKFHVYCDEFVGWCVRTFREWEFDDDIIVNTMTNFVDISDTTVQATKICLDRLANNKDYGEIGDEINAMFLEDDDPYYWGEVRNILSLDDSPECSTIVKVTSNITGESLPLMIYGDADKGDEIMLVKLHSGNKILGIVANNCFERKGICICKRVDLSDDLYTLRKFLL